MIALPLLRFLALSLSAMLVVGRLEVGDSDLTDVDFVDQGFLGLLSRMRPDFLKAQMGVAKRGQFGADADNSAANAAKRRSKNAKCMADFWKGRGLVRC